MKKYYDMSIHFNADNDCTERLMNRLLQHTVHAISKHCPHLVSNSKDRQILSLLTVRFLLSKLRHGVSFL